MKNVTLYCFWRHTKTSRIQRCWKWTQVMNAIVVSLEKNGKKKNKPKAILFFNKKRNVWLCSLILTTYTNKAELSAKHLYVVINFSIYVCFDACVALIEDYTYPYNVNLDLSKSCGEVFQTLFVYCTHSDAKLILVIKYDLLLCYV